MVTIVGWYRATSCWRGASRMERRRTRSGSIGERLQFYVIPFAHRLPPDVKATVQKLPERGHPRTRRDRDVNFLYDVTRSEYPKILFETTVYRAVFGNIIDARGKEKLKDVLELGFSLTDRTAHRDRAAYFREHATEIGDVLQSTPSMLEVFHSICRRFLAECSFEYERRGEEAIIGRFLAEEKLPVPSKPIQVSAKDATDLWRFTLERLASKELQVSALGSVCASPNALPETQLVVLRALVKRKFVDVGRSAFSPATLSITDVGAKQLKSSST